MKTLTKWSAKVLLVLMAISANAETDNLNNYYALLQDVETLYQHDGRHAVISQAKKHLSLGHAVAASVTDFLVLSAEEARLTVEDVANRMLCSKGELKHDLEGSYGVIALIAEITRTKLRQQVAIGVTQFGATTFSAFGQWLASLRDANAGPMMVGILDFNDRTADEALRNCFRRTEYGHSDNAADH